MNYNASRLNDVIFFTILAVVWGLLHQSYLMWFNIGIVTYCIVYDIVENINERLQG